MRRLLLWSSAWMLLLIVFWGRIMEDHYFWQEETVGAFRDVPPPPLSQYAVLSIALGHSVHASGNLERFVSSVRQAGQWEGFVVVLTDHPLIDATSKDPYLIQISPRRIDWDWTHKADIPYKRFKTMLLEYVHRHSALSPVQTLLYLDVDIVVGNSLSNYFTHLELTYLQTSNDNDNNISKLYFYKGNFLRFPLQSGQFVLQNTPPSSQTCLLVWRRELDRMRNQKDQVSLQRLFEDEAPNKSNTNCTLVQMPHNQSHLVFPTTDKETLHLLHNQLRPTLVHFKNSKLGNDVSPSIQQRYLEFILNTTNVIVTRQFVVRRPLWFVRWWHMMMIVAVVGGGGILGAQRMRCLPAVDSKKLHRRRPSQARLALFGSNSGAPKQTAL